MYEPMLGALTTLAPSPAPVTNHSTIVLVKERRPGRARDSASAERLDRGWIVRSCAVTRDLRGVALRDALGDRMSTEQTIGALLRDRYEILSTLGQGGFGIVYKARQIATGQIVAIKVLSLPEGGSGHAHEKRVVRFQREMQLCAQLHHPNIVRLIDSGHTEGDIGYTIFEFAPGKDLAQVLANEGRLDPQEARHLMLQVLDALACAHGQGVVHRDMKPANLMIIPTGARRNALVLDFGIGALTENARREDHARLTLTNESLGTPAYAAPEQLRGQPLTRRSDLYAWASSSSNASRANVSSRARRWPRWCGSSSRPSRSRSRRPSRTTRSAASSGARRRKIPRRAAPPRTGSCAIWRRAT